MGSAVVTNQVAQHGGGLFGADTWGVLAIVVGIAACLVLGFGLRMLMKSRPNKNHKDPGLPGRGPRFGSRNE